jgi:hypothetical protein
MQISLPVGAAEQEELPLPGRTTEEEPAEGSRFGHRQQTAMNCPAVRARTPSVPQGYPDRPESRAADLHRARPV